MMVFRPNAQVPKLIVGVIGNTAYSGQVTFTGWTFVWWFMGWHCFRIKTGGSAIKVAGFSLDKCKPDLSNIKIHYAN